MNEELRDRIIAYRITMSIVKTLLEEGTISAEEYGKIDTIMTNKYGLNSSTIFA